MYLVHVLLVFIIIFFLSGLICVCIHIICGYTSGVLEHKWQARLLLNLILTTNTIKSSF